MKFQLFITKTEIKNILRDHFRLDTNCDLEFSVIEERADLLKQPKTNPQGRSLLFSLNLRFEEEQIYSEMTGFNIAPSKKIAAIKLLREFAQNHGYIMGLAHAKYAIEHFDEFMKMVEEHGWPHESYFILNQGWTHLCQK